MRMMSLALLLILSPVALAGGEDVLAGNWKVNLLEDGQVLNFWILKFESKDGKITGLAQNLRRVPPSTMDNVQLQGDLLLFTIRLNQQVQFSFEGKLPRPGAKKIYGSISRGGNQIPVMLESTPAANQYELDRELILRTPSDPRVFNTLLELLGEAKTNKATEKDVKDWVDAVLKAAENNYGPRWANDYSLKLLEALAGSWSNIAVDVAAQIENSLDPKAPAQTQMRVLGVLANVLKKAGQGEKAKAFEARTDKLESEAYSEYEKTALNYKTPKFAGRKGKSNRAVLVESFTGGQCPPCVGADLAFDGLERAYGPKEVVLLQYHLHVPGADALTNPDTEARAEFYGPLIRGTPTMLFNGKPAAPGGGGVEDAEDKFKEYQGVIDPLLEQNASVQVAVDAVRKGDKISIKATASDVEMPSDKLRLRLALVEDWVRYKARNGLSYHHRVVRALPGGAKGIALTGKTGEITATVDVEELRNNFNKYLDEVAKEDPFPDSQRPMRMRDLHVVAFVQNDMTGEILQAVDAKVRDE